MVREGVFGVWDVRNELLNFVGVVLFFLDVI